MSPQRLPVSIITGFLGSGKTTLLNSLLQHSSLANSLVVINEFGEVGIDHLLISTPSENMRLLSNGCLCCTVRGDLVETLIDATHKRDEGLIPRFERILIETTGLADPVPLVQTIVKDSDVSQACRLDTVVGVVDAVNIRSQLGRHPEAAKQVVVSDVLLLSKTDLCDSGHVEEIQRVLGRLNPGAAIVKSMKGAIDPELVLSCPESELRAISGDIERWISSNRFSQHCDIHGADCAGHHGSSERSSHVDQVHSFVLKQAHPTTPAALVSWMTMLVSFRGANLLRVKGLVNVEGKPVVIHAVQAIVHEPMELDAWPSSDRSTRIVFIVRDLKRSDIERSFSLLATDGIPGGGAFDAAAYTRFLEMTKAFH